MEKIKRVSYVSCEGCCSGNQKSVALPGSCWTMSGSSSILATEINEHSSTKKPADIHKSHIQSYQKTFKDMRCRKAEMLTENRPHASLLPNKDCL
jgi:hypothetical protein